MSTLKNVLMEEKIQNEYLNTFYCIDLTAKECITVSWIKHYKCDMRWAMINTCICTVYVW